MYTNISVLVFGTSSPNPATWDAPASLPDAPLQRSWPGFWRKALVTLPGLYNNPAAVLDGILDLACCSRTFDLSGCSPTLALKQQSV